MKKPDFNDSSIVIGMVALVVAAAIKDITFGIALGGVFFILIGILRQRHQQETVENQPPGGEQDGRIS